MNVIEVMQVGSPVLIGEKIKATVTAVMLRDKDNVQYQCAWWDGSEADGKERRNENWIQRKLTKAPPC